jgi:hypothetical protein
MIDKKHWKESMNIITFEWKEPAMHGAHLTSGSQKSNKFILLRNHGSQQKTKESIAISNSGSQRTQRINQRTFFRTVVLCRFFHENRRFFDGFEKSKQSTVINKIK